MASVYTIYTHEPFTIYSLTKLENDLTEGVKLGTNFTGEVKTVICKQYPQDLSRFCGSAVPIPFDNGYLELTHINIYTEKRNYLHYFVSFDKDFVIKSISKPFIFFNRGIEYCCGMCIDHSGDKLILPVSSEDKEIKLMFVDLAVVRKMLE